MTGQTITFYAGQGNTSGTPLCSATTDQNGNASCGGLAATSAAVFAGGVTAVFSGSAPYRGSSGSAGVL